MIKNKPIATIATSPLARKVLELMTFVGNTPLFPLRRVFQKPGVKVLAKLEWQQLGGSVKARPAFNIIRQAIAAGQLREGQHLLDATSGNTGIAYATIGAALGVPVTLCLPENASQQRKAILRALGVHLKLTSPFEGTDGAQQAARQIARQHPERYFYADQYANNHNWQAHYHHTATEIWQQTEGAVTHFVAGLGTTGTFMGSGRRLKEYKPGIRLISLQPDTPMHGLEGWKHLETAIVPKFYRSGLADENLEIATEGAYELVKKVAEKEGLLISPSAAANLLGALKMAEQIDSGTVVTVFPDNAEKYPEAMEAIFG